MDNHCSMILKYKNNYLNIFVYPVCLLFTLDIRTLKTDELKLGGTYLSSKLINQVVQKSSVKTKRQ